jgi:hypothetical protein
MRVWLVCFVALFSLSEFYQWAIASSWLQQIELLPMPILMGAGMVLAIASNAKKRLPWQAWPSRPAEAVPEQASAAMPARSIEPPLPQATQSAPSISFQIRQPDVKRSKQS